MGRLAGSGCFRRRLREGDLVLLGCSRRSAAGLATTGRTDNAYPHLLPRGGRVALHPERPRPDDGGLPTSLRGCGPASDATATIAANAATVAAAAAAATTATTAIAATLGGKDRLLRAQRGRRPLSAGQGCHVWPSPRRHRGLAHDGGPRADHPGGQRTAAAPPHRHIRGAPPTRRRRRPWCTLPPRSPLSRSASATTRPSRPTYAAAPRRRPCASHPPDVPPPITYFPRPSTRGNPHARHPDLLRSTDKKQNPHPRGDDHQTRAAPRCG